MNLLLQITLLFFLERGVFYTMIPYCNGSVNGGNDIIYDQLDLAFEDSFDLTPTGGGLDQDYLGGFMETIDVTSVEYDPTPRSQGHKGINTEDDLPMPSFSIPTSNIPPSTVVSNSLPSDSNMGEYAGSAST